MCFFLHYGEHKGIFQSLQYKLAYFLQTKHQPNVPFSIPTSLTMLILFLYNYLSFLDLNSLEDGIVLNGISLV